MIERRKAFKGANTKTPGIMEEGGIRYYLQVSNSILSPIPLL